MKVPGKRMNEAHTYEMRDPSGRRKSPFSGLALPYAIKVKFESADDISQFSTFRISARLTCISLARLAESPESLIVKHSAGIPKQTLSVCDINRRRI